MTRPTSSTLAAAALAAWLGCGSDPAAIVTEEGPVVLALEGEVSRVSIDVDGAPPSGACAPPFASDTFEVVPDYGAGLFDQLSLQTNLGGVELVVEPRCDAVAPNASDVLVPVVIRSRDGCAREREIVVQVRDSRGPACAPIVTAWQGDCTQPPAQTSAELAIASEAAPEPVCLRFESRDPQREQLWVTLTDTLPVELINANSLTVPQPIIGASTVTVPLGDTTDIKGRFNLNYSIALEQGGTPSVDDAVVLRVGSAGLSFTVPANTVGAVELDSTPIPVRLWRLDDANPDDPLCMRARRELDALMPLDRRKPFARVENVQTGDEGVSDPTDPAQTTPWVCGRSFRLHLSPPLDAPPVEHVRVEVVACSDCQPETVPAVSGVIDVPVRSVAGQMACSPGDDNTDNIVVCANVTGNTAPDILMLKRGGTTPAACVFAGVGQGRHVPLAWEAPVATNAPLQVVSLVWRTAASVARPTILGSFAGEVRRLEITNDSPRVARWLSDAAIQLPGDAELRAGVPLASDLSGGMTHYALPAGRSIAVYCISAGAAGCTQTTLPNIAPVGSTITHVTRADLDGDGIAELVAFSAENAVPNYMTVHGVKLSWTAGVPAVAVQVNAATTLTGGPMRTAAKQRTCALPPCRETVFGVSSAFASTNEAVQVMIPNGQTQLSVDTVSTLSATRDITGYLDRIIVGMEFGISEAVGTGETIAWFVRDPVILEDRLVGPVTSQPLGYAGSVGRCVSGTEPSVAFTADTDTVRWTELDIDVVLP